VASGSTSMTNASVAGQTQTNNPSRLWLFWHDALLHVKTSRIAVLALSVAASVALVLDVAGGLVHLAGHAVDNK
jgi:hypothetical protein